MWTLFKCILKQIKTTANIGIANNGADITYG
jgi:hypothetical protein